MTEDEIIEALREAAANSSPVELAEKLDKLTGGALTQGAVVTYFKRAVPAIPLRALLEAGAWNRVSNGDLSDEAFNQLLEAWIPTGAPRPK
jgi:hypothetical protein